MRGLLVLVGVRWAAVVVSGGFSWMTREDEISKTGEKMSPVAVCCVTNRNNSLPVALFLKEDRLDGC